MTIGVGGATADQVLAELADRTRGVEPITDAELLARQARAQELMREQGLDALYLHASTNLRYFTGVRWHASERMVAAVLPAAGDPVWIAPAFERETLRSFQRFEAEVRCWEEHESPYEVLARVLGGAPGARGTPRRTEDLHDA